MRKIIFIILLFTVFESYSQTDTIRQSDYQYISIVNIICNPKDFHGEKVMVDGYLILEFEGSALYLNDDDYKHSRTKNAISISFNKKISREQLDTFNSFNAKNVSIIGIIKKEHDNLFSSRIVVDDILIVD